MFRLLYVSIVVLCLSACSTAVINQETNINLILHDHLFANHSEVRVETADEIFALSPEMIDFVDQNVLIKSSTSERVKVLATVMLEKLDESILYQNSANTIAAETFATGRANCLSLTIMTYALAEYSDLGVNFQQVDIPEIWVLRDGDSLLNRHVNLKLFKKPDNKFIKRDDTITIKWGLGPNYTIDFDQQPRGQHLPKKTISKNRVLSMFYNNKGADAILQNDYNKAYAYFKKALQVDPQMVDAFVNLGVMYRRMGHKDKAEKSYELASKIAPGDFTLMENLADLYTVTGRVELAKEILDRLEQKRHSNPYYHYLLGEQALEKNNPAQAKPHFLNAINLLEGNHEFYFAMAKTLFLLGDREQSRRYMNRAKKSSLSKTDEMRYQYKLDRYSNLLDRKK